MSETTELHAYEDNRIDLDHHENEETDTHQEGERPKSLRDIAMEEIARRRIEAINRELRHGEDLADEARRDAGLEPLAHDRDDEDEETPSRGRHQEEPTDREEPVQEKKAEPTLRTITIDGNTFSVTEDQYAALAGLGARTNVALQQHNHAQAQEQMQRGNAQNPYQQPAVQNEQNVYQRGSQQQQHALSDEEAEGVAERLIYGGKEQVAQTVKELSNRLVERTRQEQVNENEIVNRAARHAIEQQQLQSDLTTISTEYPRIWEEKVLGELAAIQLNHIRAENMAMGRSMGNLDMFREACNRVEAAIGAPKESPVVNRDLNAQASSRTSSRAGDRSEVLDRKRAAPSQPSAQGRRVTEVAAPRQRSASEIVQSMRVARQQTPY